MDNQPEEVLDDCNPAVGRQEIHLNCINTGQLLNTVQDRRVDGSTVSCRSVPCIGQAMKALVEKSFASRTVGTRESGSCICKALDVGGMEIGGIIPSNCVLGYPRVESPE